MSNNLPRVSINGVDISHGAVKDVFVEMDYAPDGSVTFESVLERQPEETAEQFHKRCGLGVFAEEEV